MKLLSTFIAAIFFVTASGATAHDPTGHHQYEGWFISQLQTNGITPCCGDIDDRGGDAHYVDVKKVGDDYYVSINGTWVLYPLPVDPYFYNPTGHNVAWYKPEGQSYTFYCLRLAIGS